MNATLDAFLRSWPNHPWLWASLGVAALVYTRGFIYWHARDPDRWPYWRLLSFAAALASLGFALGSPIEPFSSLLLQVHMVQHLLLMMVFAPLLWASAPFFPILRGLPEAIRVDCLGPFLRWRRLRQCALWLTHPVVALTIYTVMTWCWHVPVVYERALRSETWHYFEHASFIVAALLFWYGILRPFPARPRWSPWTLLPVLILADLQNTVLSALFAFSRRPVYSFYAAGPRIAGISALDDQHIAGVLMWIPGSVAFLLPLFIITARLLYGSRRSTELLTPGPRRHRAVTLPVFGQATRGALRSKRRLDLLEVSVIGAILRWPYARLSVQLLSLAVAILIMADGFLSSAAAPMNFAGVLPWIHWRAVVIIGLIGAGNFACLACPLTLPRKLLNGWLPRGLSLPRQLHNKWLSIGLIWLFFWAYEAFKLWDSPWLTAWIVLGYFTAALTVDCIFKPGTFCKHICPIGQFNFALSFIAPLTVSARDPNVCASCLTKDCIRGNAKAAGCALDLYQPHKQGNLDCTFCLDCIHACPHKNVGVLHVDRKSLLRPRVVRWDVVVLILTIVFAAFANAAAMVAPVLALEDRIAGDWGFNWLTTTSIGFAALYMLLPAAIIGGAILLTGKDRYSSVSTYSTALLPIGLAMWAAHYGFHFATSYASVIPITERLVRDLGISLIGPPHWRYSCCAAVADWIPRAQILALDLGLLGSLYLVYRGALGQNRNRPQMRELLPWGAVVLLLFAAGVWVVLQPMEMRGLLPPDGSAQVARSAP